MRHGTGLAKSVRQPMHNPRCEADASDRVAGVGVLALGDL